MIFNLECKGSVEKTVGAPPKGSLTILVGNLGEGNVNVKVTHVDGLQDTQVILRSENLLEDLEVCLTPNLFRLMPINESAGRGNKSTGLFFKVRGVELSNHRRKEPRTAPASLEIELKVCGLVRLVLFGWDTGASVEGVDSISRR